MRGVLGVVTALCLGLVIGMLIQGQSGVQPGSVEGFGSPDPAPRVDQPLRDGVESASSRLHVQAEPAPAEATPATILEIAVEHEAIPAAINVYNLRLPATSAGWLADQELSPGGLLKCSALGDSLYRAVVEQEQVEIAQLQELHASLRVGVAEAKIAGGVDIAQRDAPLPPDAIMSISVASMRNGALAPSVTTVLRRGDSPEPDRSDDELKSRVADGIRRIHDVMQQHCQ